MAQKKGSSNTSNGRDSRSQRLGVKMFGGQYAIPGNILVRQRGTKIKAGAGVKTGRDHTLYSVVEGFIRFHDKFGRKFISVDAVEWDDEEETTVETVSASQ